jgi:hypothetical protein
MGMENTRCYPALQREAPERTWLNGARWDLTWLIGSAAIVPVTLFFVWLGVSSDVMNLVVTLLFGGPHVFATFLTTYLDPGYRRGHRWTLVALAVLVPAFVIFMTLAHFQVLMSFFIFAASLHVLQQNAYLADLYRARAGRRDSLVSRLLDYGVLFLSFYPIASYKLVHDDFMLGNIRILIPSIAKSALTYQALSSAFVVVLSAWMLKSVMEWKRGLLNGPKTVLIALTSSIAFLVPAAASGTRLELAFQTVNVWHSIQYLSLAWLALALRKQEAGERPRLLDLVSGLGKPTWRFYALCFAFTSALLGVIVLVRWTDPLRLSTEQYYYMSVLSVLFIHYAFDGYFFLVGNREGIDQSRVPLAFPSAS